MNLSEIIKQLLEERDALFQKLQGIHEKATEEARLLSDEESKEFEELTAKIGELDKQIERNKQMESLAASRAVPAGHQPAIEDDTKSAAAPSGSQPAPKAELGQGVEVDDDAVKHATFKAVDDLKSLKKGVLFARVAIAKALARKSGVAPERVAASRWGDHMAEVVRCAQERELLGGISKAAVAPGDTTTPAWAGELTDEMTTGFVEMLRAASIMPRLPMRTMSFDDAEGINIPRQTGSVIAGYVGQGNSIKASKQQYDAINLYPYKLACLVPVTNEILRRSNPDIELLIRDDLIESATAVSDRQFIDGTAVVGVAPEGITVSLPGTHTRTATMAGATPTVEEVTSDLAFLMTALRNAKIPMAAPGWIMSERTRVFLTMQRTSDDRFAWRDELVNGTLLGMPVYSSTTVPIDGGVGTDESLIILADFNQIIFAQGQTPTVDASTEATIQSDDDPATPPDLTANQFSAFQQDSMILRLRMEHDWQKRHATCVAALTAVKY